MILRKILLTEPWPRVIGIPLVALLMNYIHKLPPYTLNDYLVSFIMTFAIWQGDYMIIMGLRKKMPSLEETNKRILISVGLVAFYNFLADTTLCELLAGFDMKKPTDWSKEYLGKLAILFATTFIIGTLYETGYFFNQWRKQSIQIEQIKSQQLRSELSVLKNQVSPHFLFNSLNTLVTLINENQQQAAAFTEKLSEVYRYILQVKDKEIVSLKTEMEFVKSYCFLMKMRFENGIELNCEIEEKFDDKYVVPLTLQMLVENALKHNVVSASKPLHIDIYIENGKSIIVRNNLQRKSSAEHSLKTGLENIRKRYSLLSDKNVDVIETKDHFMVAMPLLALSKPSKLIPES